MAMTVTITVLIGAILTQYACYAIGKNVRSPLVYQSPDGDRRDFDN